MNPYYMCHYCGEWEKDDRDGVLFSEGYYCGNCAEKPERKTFFGELRAKYYNWKWNKEINRWKKLRGELYNYKVKAKI